MSSSSRLVRTLSLSLLAAIAACSASGDTPDDEGDDLVPSEATESAVAVTSTPGKAVWTKLWRWESGGQQVTAEDVAADETGAQYLLRSFAFGETPSTTRVTSMDVTRYSPTGTMGFRTGLGTPGYERYDAHLAARAGRIALAGTQDYPYTPTRQGVVHLLTTGGVQERIIELRAQRTEWTLNGEPRVTEGDVKLNAVAVDGDGATLVVGQVSGDADFGGGMMRDPNPGNNDGFLLKLRRDGSVEFSRRFEGSLTTAVGVDGARAIYVAGNGTLTTPPNGPAPSVTKFTRSGAIVRTTVFRTSGFGSISHLAVSAGGRVAVGGHYSVRLEMGSIVLTDKYGSKLGEPFFAKLDPEGTPVFGRSFAGTARRQVAGVGIDSYGQVVGTINFNRDIEVGAQTYTTDTDDVGNVLVKLASLTGEIRWSSRYSGTGAVMNEVTATGLAITSSDRIAMSGIFRKDVDFGKGPITGSLVGNSFLTRFNQ